MHGSQLSGVFHPKFCNALANWEVLLHLHCYNNINAAAAHIAHLADQTGAEAITKREWTMAGTIGALY